MNPVNSIGWTATPPVRRAERFTTRRDLWRFMRKVSPTFGSIFRRVLTVLGFVSSVVCAFSSCGNKSADRTDQSALTSIAVQPASMYIMAGTAQQFTAVGTYADNTSGDVTALVSWGTSDTTKATVSNEPGTEGVLTAVDGGSVEITASTGGVTSSAAVHVMSIGVVPTNNTYVQLATIRTDKIDQIDNVSYRIHTKPGNHSKDVDVSYSLSYLTANSYVDNTVSKVTVPVFGLYAAYANTVSVSVYLKNGQTIEFPLTIQTGVNPNEETLLRTEVTKTYIDPKTSFMLFATGDAPTIIDIDGETRWQFYKSYVATAGALLADNDSLLLGGNISHILRVNLSGDVTEEYEVPDTRYTGFSHNFDRGKSGIFGNMQYNENNINKILSVLVEVSPKAKLLETWHFDNILGATIRESGEDPTGFVRNGIDWFHLNSTAYSARDDSIIVSSRENFVLKIDYSTKRIRWILGNTAKKWYQLYPLSLQPLTLEVIGKAPIGQHAVSLVDSGVPGQQSLLLFNNGLGGTPGLDVDVGRTYSAVSLYEIDETARTATEVWTFDADQQYYSPSCSSAYKTAGGDFLVNFATTEWYKVVVIMIVDVDKNVLFSMKVPKRTIDTGSCGTAYLVREIRLENMQLH
jgi:arylsulfate sulfotransferase